MEKRVKIKILKNGPIVVGDKVTIVTDDGVETNLDKPVLCRCGHSGNKPFCDGSHKRENFNDEDV